MKELAGLLTQPISRSLALALVHFLWQGTVVAVLLAACDALMTRASAHARYAAACAALGLMLLLPVATVWRLSETGANALSVPVAGLKAPGSRGAVAARVKGLVPADRLARITPWIVAGWLAGVSLLSIRFLGGFLAAQRLKRRRTRAASPQWEERLADLGKRLRISQPVRLLESALVEVPTAVGILRPVVLLPAGVATGLTSDQLDSLLAHELAHILRRDCLANLIQAFAETLLFYHPAVWWVSHRIRVERENSCDDLAVGVTGNPAAYARALVLLEERREPAPRLAVAADGGRLFDRVTRLFPASEVATGRPPRWLAAALTLGGLFAVGVAAQIPTLEDSAGSSEDGVVHASSTAARSGKDCPGKPRSATGGKIAKAGLEAGQAAEPAPPLNATGAPDGDAGPAGRLLTPAELVAFRIHGVTPEYIDRIIALGYDEASPDDLLALRIHGVTPDYIAQMTKAFGKLPLADYAAFRIHGLTPETAAGLEAAFGKLSADDALAMRIHCVTPEFAQSMRSLGLANLSADDVLALRIHGVTPEFVKEIRSLGYASISADDLLAFRIHGVTPEYIRTANHDAGRKLSADRLIESRIHDDEEVNP